MISAPNINLLHESIETNKPSSVDLRTLSAIDKYIGSIAQRRQSAIRISKLRRNIIAFFEDTCADLHSLTIDTIERWAARKQFAGFRSRSIYSIIQEVRAFTRWCVANNLIRYNPLEEFVVEVDEDECVERHQLKFQRLFSLVEILSKSRYGMSFQHLHRAHCEFTEVCTRTTRRDIELLLNLGFIDSETQRINDLATKVYRVNLHCRLFQLARQMSVNVSPSPIHQR